MRLDICFLFFVGCFIHMSNGEGNDKSVNATSQPDILQSRIQKHTIEKKSPEKPQPTKKTEAKEKEKEEIIVHDHGDRNFYESQVRDYKPDDKYNFDNEYNDDTFDKYVQEFKSSLDRPDDEDGFKTSKTVHTEHFEIKEINPKATSPEEKYVIRGGYKVQETDPFDSKSKKTHLHTYDSPLSKIAASIYSKFDYLNFPYNNDNNDSDENLDSEERQENSDEKKEDNENKEDYYGNDFSSYEKDDRYNDNANNNVNDNEKKSPDYAPPVSNEQKKPDDKEETRTMEYYSIPTDTDTIYNKDWKNYILQQVYGDHDEYYAPSSIYEMKLRARRKI